MLKDELEGFTLKGWTRRLEVFLNEWSTKVLHYELTKDSPIPEKDKKNYLKKAIESHSGLNQAYHAARIQAVTNKKQLATAGVEVPDLAFEDEFELIKQKAIHLDRTWQKQNEMQKAARAERKAARRKAKQAKQQESGRPSNWLPPEEFQKLSASEKQERKRRYQEWKERNKGSQEANAATLTILATKAEMAKEEKNEQKGVQVYHRARLLPCS